MVILTITRMDGSNDFHQGNQFTNWKRRKKKPIYKCKPPKTKNKIRKIQACHLGVFTEYFLKKGKTKSTVDLVLVLYYANDVKFHSLIFAMSA